LVLNLVKLAGAALPCLVAGLMLSFSAKHILERIRQNANQIKSQMIRIPEILQPNPIKLKILE
jgi:hypothetical protein